MGVGNYHAMHNGKNVTSSFTDSSKARRSGTFVISVFKIYEIKKIHGKVNLQLLSSRRIHSENNSGDVEVCRQWKFSLWKLKGHSQLRDRADLDTTFASLKSVYLNPKSNVRVGYI